MSKELTLFDTLNASKSAFKAPAHVASFFGEESNITERASVPSLSYEGKVWTISLNGEKTKMMKRDADGDETPVGVMRVIVLDYAKRRGRAYYPGAYDPAKVAMPYCWSDDGVAPDPAVPADKRGAAKCDGCPLAAKGSKVTEQGKAVTACSQHRMLVVVPAGKPDFEPLRMKIAITSDWDKQSPELETQGWFGFQNYTDFLRAKGVQHTAALVTKMKFDPNVAYPKVIFSPDRWLNDDELAIVRPVVKDEKIQKLLAGTYTPNGVDGVVKDDEPEVLPPPKKAAAKPAPVDEDEEEAAPAPKPVPARKAKSAVVEEAATKAAASGEKFIKVNVDEDDDGEITLPSAAPAKKAAPAAAPATAAVPDDVKDLLAEWGED